MREYPLITYVVFAGVAAWAFLSVTRRNFRRGTNRRKAAADIPIWIAVAFGVLVLVLMR